MMQSTMALGEAPTTSPVPSLVEVATPESGGEERQAGGRQRMAWEKTVPCRVTLGAPSPASGEGLEVGWVGRGPLSSDMPFLSSLQQADPQPCTPRHHPEKSDCPGTRGMLAAEGYQAGLTRELVGVARGETCITPAGVGCGLETWIT